jgi:hypothetical protein
MLRFRLGAMLEYNMILQQVKLISQKHSPKNQKPFGSRKKTTPHHRWSMVLWDQGWQDSVNLEILIRHMNFRYTSDSCKLIKQVTASHSTRS